MDEKAGGSLRIAKQAMHRQISTEGKLGSEIDGIEVRSVWTMDSIFGIMPWKDEAKGVCESWQRELLGSGLTGVCGPEPLVSTDEGEEAS